MELGGSMLVLVGLATRLSVLALLGVVLVIQTLVYPEAWPDRIQQLAYMLLLPIPLLMRYSSLVGRQLPKLNITLGSAFEIG